MRNLLLAACVLTSLVASAGSKSDSRFLTWVGGDTGAFEDSANWRDTSGNAATPAHYDTLVFPKGGTFTKGSSYLTLWGITVTSPDPVTIRTGSLTFEGGADIVVSGTGTATFEGMLACGYKQTDQVNIKVAAGSTANFDGDISGPGGVVYADLGTVFLNGTNTYAGKTTFRLGQVHVRNDWAFGSCTNGAADGVVLNLDSETAVDQLKVFFDESHTFGEYFDLKTHKRIGDKLGYPLAFAAGTTTTFTGTVHHASAVMYQLQGDAKIVHAGPTQYTNPSFTFNAPAEIVMAGELTKFWDDYMGGTGHLRIQKPMQMDSSVPNPQTRAYWLRCYGTGVSKSLECENAIYTNGVLGYLQWQGNGTIDICGFDQTFWTLDCGVSFPKGVLLSERPATVHLNLTDSWNQTASKFYGQVNGQITLSLEGPKPIQFYGQSKTTGALALTNAANLAFMAGATWAGKLVAIRGGSTLTLNDGVFADDVEIEIMDDEDGVKPKSKLVMNANKKIGRLVLNGVEIEQGKTVGSTQSDADIQDDEHFGGPGQVAVGEAQFDPTEATWTNGGADRLMSTVENWDIAPKLPNFNTGLVTLTFAEDGDAAWLTGDTHVKGVVFTGRDFTLAAAPSSPEAKLVVGSSQVVVQAPADTQSHTNRIDVPLVMTEEELQVAVEGVKSTLVQAGPVTAPEGVTASFIRRGEGTFVSDGENLVPGSRRQINGTWYAKARSLGPAGTTVTIAQDSTAKNPLRFYLNGGTFEQKFSLARTQSPTYSFGAAAGSTNYLTQAISYQDSYGIEFNFLADSWTEFQNGFTKTGSWTGCFYFSPRASVVFSGAPFAFGDSNLPAKMGNYNTAPSARARIEFAAAGGYARTGLAVGGGIDVHFTADAAFSTNSFASPLFLGRCGEAHPALHLHGTEQYFGSVMTNAWADWNFPNDTTGATVTSDAEGGVLHVCQTTDMPCHAFFTGSASLEKSGVGTLTLAAASPSTGTLTVSAGTLDFAADVAEAGWTNCLAVVVSGGTLKVDRKNRLAKGAAYTLTGGALEIAAGVRLRGASLALPDGVGGMRVETVGVFSASNCPYIRGEGELCLQTGTMILVK